MIGFRAVEAEFQCRGTAFSLGVRPTLQMKDHRSQSVSGRQMRIDRQHFLQRPFRSLIVLRVDLLFSNPLQCRKQLRIFFQPPEL